MKERRREICSRKGRGKEEDKGDKINGQGEKEEGE